MKLVKILDLNLSINKLNKVDIIKIFNGDVQTEINNNFILNISNYYQTVKKYYIKIKNYFLIIIKLGNNVSINSLIYYYTQYI